MSFLSWELLENLERPPGLRHHPAIINKISRVTILSKSGDKIKTRDKF